MKYLKLFEDFDDSLLPKPAEFTKNDEVAELIIKSDSNVFLKQESGMYGEFYFEIEGIGKMKLGNYEIFGTGKNFADSHDNIENMTYWWRGMNDVLVGFNLDGKYEITELLSEFILNKLKIN